MNKYSRFINNFNEQFFKNLDNKTESIIEAAVEYYGEQHRNKITDILNNVNIITFLPTSTEPVFRYSIHYNMTIKSADITNKIICLLGFPNICTMRKLRLGSVALKKNGTVDIEKPMVSEVYNSNYEKIDDLLEAIFGSTKLFFYDYKNNSIYNFFNYSKKKQKMLVKRIFNSDTITQEIKDRINNAIKYMDQQKEKTHVYEKYANAAYFYDQYKRYKNDPVLSNRIIGANKNIVPAEFEVLTDHPSMLLLPNGLYIAIPVFFITDMHFIHELNHALTATILATIDDKYIIEKSGTDALNSLETVTNNKNNSEDHILHELLNERMAQDISEIFHNNGGSIFDETNTYDIPVKIPYRIMLPLIEDFYQEYKELIKEASISENQKLLYSQIDKKALQDFSEFINKTYIEILNSDETELTQEQLDKAAYYTERLQRKPHTEVSSEDYLILLEMDGHKVTYLHHHDHDNQPKALAKAKKKK